MRARADHRQRWPSSPVEARTIQPPVAVRTRGGTQPNRSRGDLFAAKFHASRIAPLSLSKLRLIAEVRRNLADWTDVSRFQLRRSAAAERPLHI